ncbi:hypothetical protein [Roseobacter sp.]|uniref:hypothetical protein n=1 Tax=Roseobacter sp. TaxID=1907202 RepID=UPI0029664211|nr:hypothetical protein [Roseobacter sp.]MDW3181782.1 hypothetical protein [Roseobacter sp.]
MEHLTPFLLDLGLPGAVIAYLLVRDRRHETKINDLQEKRVEDVKPIIEALSQNTNALSSMAEVNKDLAAEIRARGS